MAEARTAPGVRIQWYAVVQFIAHLGALALGCYSLWQMGGGWWLGALAGVVFAVVYGAIWATWLAAGSARRRSYRGRLLTVLLSGTAIVVLAGFGGVWLPAVIAVSIIVLCDALGEGPSDGAADGLE